MPSKEKSSFDKKNSKICFRWSLFSRICIKTLWWTLLPWCCVLYNANLINSVHLYVLTPFKLRLYISWKSSDNIMCVMNAKTYRKKILKSRRAAACSGYHSRKAVGSREAPFPLTSLWKIFIPKEMSLSGRIDTKLGRRAFLSGGLPAASSDKDRHPRGNVGLSLKFKMAWIPHLPLLKNGLESFPDVSWVRQMSPSK